MVDSLNDNIKFIKQSPTAWFKSAIRSTALTAWCFVVAHFLFCGFIFYKRSNAREGAVTGHMFCLWGNNSFLIFSGKLCSNRSSVYLFHVVLQFQKKLRRFCVFCHNFSVNVNQSSPIQLTCVNLELENLPQRHALTFILKQYSIFSHKCYTVLDT